MMRLQGMIPSEFNMVTSEAQLGRQIGNAMSVNVIERILVSLLPAAGLTSPGRLADRWKDGSAIRAMNLDKDRSFKNHMLLMHRRVCLRMIRRRIEIPDEDNGTAGLIKEDKK